MNSANVSKRPDNGYDFFWYLKRPVHDYVDHPLLPTVELFDDTKHYKLANPPFFRFHDSATSDGNNYNKQWCL